VTAPGNPQLAKGKRCKSEKISMVGNVENQRPEDIECRNTSSQVPRRPKRSVSTAGLDIQKREGNLAPPPIFLALLRDSRSGNDLTDRHQSGKGKDRGKWEDPARQRESIN